MNIDFHPYLRDLQKNNNYPGIELNMENIMS